MEDPFDLPPDVLRRIPLFAELSKVLSWSGGPVNWDLARQIATSVAAGERPSAAVTDDDHRQVADHVRVAELWLADQIGAAAPTHLVAARAATPADWAEYACSSLRELIDPIAAKVSVAMGQQAGEAAGDEAGMLSQTLGQMAPMFLGMQAGSILGTLARDVTGLHDLGLPGGDDDLVLVLPEIDAIATGYGLDRAQVRQFVALRAAAHRWLFEGFPRTRFFALYLDYVATLSFDFSESLRRLQELDLSDPSRLQDALGDESLFSHAPSPASRTAAEQIGVFLDLIGAHIDEVVRAAGERIGDNGRIAEAFARRSTGPGTGVTMLARFIGIERGRSAAARTFVRGALTAGGWDALARLWEDPDAFPSADELTDPDTWWKRVST